MKKYQTIKIISKYFNKKDKRKLWIKKYINKGLEL